MSKFFKIKKASEEKYVVDNVTIIRTLDSYNNGEDPSTSQMIVNENNVGSFNSVKEALQSILSTYGYSDDNLKYFSYDGESIYGDILVNEKGEEVKENSEEWNSWKKGEIDLYSMTIQVYMKKATYSPLTTADTLL